MWPLLATRNLAVEDLVFEALERVAAGSRVLRKADGLVNNCVCMNLRWGKSFRGQGQMCTSLEQ